MAAIQPTVYKHITLIVFSCLVSKQKHRYKGVLKPFHKWFNFTSLKRHKSAICLWMIYKAENTVNNHWSPYPIFLKTLLVFELINLTSISMRPVTVMYIIEDTGWSKLSGANQNNYCLKLYVTICCLLQSLDFYRYFSINFFFHLK